MMPLLTPPPPLGELTQRRAAVEAKQAILASIIVELECEGVVLFQPAHVAWLTGGLTARGLIADTERPGIYTNGNQRWLLASNADSQRLFDEDLDELGFQLKEWAWPVGRAALLGELVTNRKIAADRPFPNLPAVNDRLRTVIRPLHPPDVLGLQQLGGVLAHALEATGRGVRAGDTEAEVAGQLAHRLCRDGAEPVALTVQADGRGRAYGRAGVGRGTVDQFCHLQATASLWGLHATASRTISFGPLPADAASEWELAVKLAAVLRSHSQPDGTVNGAGRAARELLAPTPHEFAWREAPCGFGTGWLCAEELRRAGQEELFVDQQAVVWQARIGAAAVVDTVLVTARGMVPITPPENWPFKRIVLSNGKVDVPDVLVK